MCLTEFTPSCRANVSCVSTYWRWRTLSVSWGCAWNWNFPNFLTPERSLEFHREVNRERRAGHTRSEWNVAHTFWLRTESFMLKPWQQTFLQIFCSIRRVLLTRLHPEPAHTAAAYVLHRCWSTAFKYLYFTSVFQFFCYLILLLHHISEGNTSLVTPLHLFDSCSYFTDWYIKQKYIMNY